MNDDTRGAALFKVKVTGTQMHSSVSDRIKGVNATVEMAKRLQPDIVVMDLSLPQLNGLDATRQILADNANSSVVLLLSTYEEEEYAPRAAECGAAAYIPKSAFGPDRLEEAWAAANDAA